MKRILFLVAITTTLVIGCKNETKNIDVKKIKKVTKEESAIPPGCTFFSPLESMGTAQRIEWLRNPQTQTTICTQYLNCVLESHRMTNDENTQVLASLGPNPTYTSIPLNQILNGKSCNYKEYRTFTKNSSGNITMGLTSNFNETTTCYSIPLFYAMQAQNITTVKFIEAMVAGERRVIFSIDNGNAFFDYSRWPAALPGKNPL